MSGPHMLCLIVPCTTCPKIHVMGNYTWDELVAECGGEPPICDECGEDLTKPEVAPEREGTQ